MNEDCDKLDSSDLIFQKSSIEESLNHNYTYLDLYIKSLNDLIVQKRLHDKQHRLIDSFEQDFAHNHYQTQFFDNYNTTSRLIREKKMIIQTKNDILQAKKRNLIKRKSNYDQQRKLIEKNKEFQKKNFSQIKHYTEKTLAIKKKDLEASKLKMKYYMRKLRFAQNFKLEECLLVHRLNEAYPDYHIVKSFITIENFELLTDNDFVVTELSRNNSYSMDIDLKVFITGFFGDYEKNRKFYDQIFIGVNVDGKECLINIGNDEIYEYGFRVFNDEVLIVIEIFFGGQKKFTKEFPLKSLLQSNVFEKEKNMEYPKVIDSAQSQECEDAVFKQNIDLKDIIGKELENGYVEIKWKCPLRYAKNKQANEYYLNDLNFYSIYNKMSITVDPKSNIMKKNAQPLGLEKLEFLTKSFEKISFQNQNIRQSSQWGIELYSLNLLVSFIKQLGGIFGLNCPINIERNENGFLYYLRNQNFKIFDIEIEENLNKNEKVNGIQYISACLQYFYNQIINNNVHLEDDKTNKHKYTQIDSKDFKQEKIDELIDNLFNMKTFGPVFIKENIEQFFEREIKNKKKNVYKVIGNSEINNQLEEEEQVEYGQNKCCKKNVFPELRINFEEITQYLEDCGNGDGAKADVDEFFCIDDINEFDIVL